MTRRPGAPRAAPGRAASPPMTPHEEHMTFDSAYRPEEVERTWLERWEAERAFHAP